VITVYGTEWCEDTQRALRQLRRLGISYAFLDVDADPAALQRARELNHGKRRTPVICFDDGETLVEPSNRTLTESVRRKDLPDRVDIGERVRLANVGDLERGLRIGCGVAAAALALKAPRALKVPLMVLGAFEVLTGTTGWCPAYTAFGVTSLGGPMDHPMEADRQSWLVRLEEGGQA
jgi:glutaredoxin